MELKKKTIIWEDNNEPPKDYIWVKSDGKAYEFDYNDRKWKESQIISNMNAGNGGTGLTGNLVDDWVTAVTQGEYTKYEDVPMAVEGEASENPGWRRVPNTLVAQSHSGLSSFSDDEIYVMIVKNGTFEEPDIPIPDTPIIDPIEQPSVG